LFHLASDSRYRVYPQTSLLTRWLAITNFFPVNGISEVVDLSRHDWNHLWSQNAPFTARFLEVILNFQKGKNALFMACFWVWSN
jgi:hypothetical protein